MFRRVSLPAGIKGGLLLHSMPGWFESWEEWLSEVEAAAVDLLVSLAGEAEIAQKSPEFARAIRADGLPVERREFPIQDFGVPADRTAFAQFAGEIAEALKQGSTVLIHCAAGIGRTGMLAVSVLVALGISDEEALLAVRHAGAGPETQAQRELVRWMSDHHAWSQD